MAESLPLPHALRFVATKDEWREFEGCLDDHNYPAGSNSYVGSNDEAFRRVERLAAVLEARLAVELSEGRLVARGRLQGSVGLTPIDGRGCEELEIFSEDGKSLRIYGLEYTYVLIAESNPKSGRSKLAERLALRSAIIAALRPHIEELAGPPRRQTNYKQLRAIVEDQGITGFATTFLKGCAAEAGLTQDMIKSGRPKKA